MAPPASLIAGFLWDPVDPSAPLMLGSAMAMLGVILLVAFRPRRIEQARLA